MSLCINIGWLDVMIVRRIVGDVKINLCVVELFTVSLE